MANWDDAELMSGRMTTDHRTVLVVDTGEAIVGIYSVADARYVPYRDRYMLEAIERIEAADELVTYNGKRYDIQRLSEIAGEHGRTFRFSAEHSDMREICWKGILGSSLRETYKRCIGVPPDFPDTYEGSNESDVYLTYRLWEVWQRDELRDIHGHVIAKNVP